MKVINTDDCNKWLNKIFSRANQITENMICAGYEDGRKDSCQVVYTFIKNIKTFFLEKLHNNC